MMWIHIGSLFYFIFVDKGVMDISDFEEWDFLEF